MVTSSKRTYATGNPSQVCCSQSPCPRSRPLLTHASAGDTQTQDYQSLVGCLGPGSHKVLFASSKCLWRVWDLIQNAIWPLLLSCWGFSLALGHRVSFFGGIQHSPVNGFSAASCNFGVLTGENEWTPFYSAILDAMKLSSLSHLGKPLLLLLFSCSVMSNTLRLFTGVNCTEKLQIKYSIVRNGFSK